MAKGRPFGLSLSHCMCYTVCWNPNWRFFLYLPTWAARRCLEAQDFCFVFCSAALSPSSSPCLACLTAFVACDVGALNTQSISSKLCLFYDGSKCLGIAFWAVQMLSVLVHILINPSASDNCLQFAVMILCLRIRKRGRK